MSPLPPAPGLSCVSASTTGEPGAPRCIARRTASSGASNSMWNSPSASATAWRSAATATCTRASSAPMPNTAIPHSGKSAIGKPGVNDSIAPCSFSSPSSIA